MLVALSRMCVPTHICLLWRGNSGMLLSGTAVSLKSLLFSGGTQRRLQDFTGLVGDCLRAEGTLQVAADNLFWLGESCPLNWDPSGRDEVPVQMIIGYLEAVWGLELVESGLLDSASWRSPKVDISDFTVFFPVCGPRGWGMPMVARCEIRAPG